MWGLVADTNLSLRGLHIRRRAARRPVLEGRARRPVLQRVYSVHQCVLQHVWPWQYFRQQASVAHETLGAMERHILPSGATRETYAWCVCEESVRMSCVAVVVVWPYIGPRVPTLPGRSSQVFTETRAYDIEVIAALWFGCLFFPE